MKSGSIPEKLSIFIRQSTKVGWRWEDVEDGGIDHEVLPCYISDADNKNTLKTGAEWASSSYWDEKTRQSVKREFSILNIENKPFTNLRIITLEIRDKGGRAYKVCADIGDYKNLYFDMREDVLLDTLFQVGIEKGGIISGEFIFARVGSQMKPVRIGSFLYDKMVEATNYNKKGKLSELVIGGVYNNKKGEPSIYLGRYWTRGAKLETIKAQNVGGYGTYNRIVKITLDEPMQVHVFHNAWALKYALKGENDYRTKKPYDIWFYSEDTKDFYGKPEHQKGDPITNGLQIIKNHSFKECEQVIDVPKDYYRVVADKVYQNYQQCEERSREWYIREYATLFNLSEDKESTSRIA